MLSSLGRCGVVAAWVFAVAGCTGGKPSAAAPRPAPGATGASGAAVAGAGAAAKPWDPARGTAKVLGVVQFEGTAPTRRKIDTAADPKCQHPEPLLDESVLVGPKGGLGNVFVWVKSGLEGWTFPVPAEPALIEQQGCVYRPHVLGLRAGQTLAIRNNDPTMHNVHAVCEENEPFNFGQGRQGMESTRVLEAPEVMLRLKCDVHGWMSAYIGVVAHPYYAVSDADGRFELTGLPAGDYTIQAWHEALGTLDDQVKLADGASTSLIFSFEDSE